MEKEYRKICYEQEAFKLHHVTGRNIGKAYSQAMHYDTGLTMAYFKTCSGTIKIEGRTYALNDGDLILLNYDELHFVSVDSDKYCERITIYVSEQILKCFPYDGKALFDVFYNRRRGTGNYIPAYLVKANSVDTAFSEILKCCEANNSISNILAVCKIIELLAKLNEEFPWESERDTLPETENSVISGVMKYINAHLTEDFDCDGIAGQFHLSKYHLGRMFKANVGISMWDYVIIRRLFLFNDLIRKNDSIKEACYKVGFHNYSNFYRLYKKHMQISPQDFKNQLDT